MKWSLRLGRLLGIDLYMHATFPLLFLLVGGYVLYSPDIPNEWVLPAMLFIPVLFTVVVMHEYGHALAARYFGIGTRDITLLPIGGLARIERMPDEPMEELAVALAGPFVNLVLAMVFACVGALIGMLEATMGIDVPLKTGFILIAMANASLFIFNLLPMFPMDGGRVLRALLGTLMDNLSATTIAVTVGRVLAVVAVGLALFTARPMLLVIAVYMWYAGAQELRMVRVRAQLDTITVRELMSTQFQTVPAQASVGLAADYSGLGWRHDFPVLDHGALVGMLSQQQVAQVIQQYGPDVPVGEAMDRDFVMAHPDDGLGTLMMRMRSQDCLSVPVVEAQELAGILSIDRVFDHLAQLNQAAANGPRRRRFGFGRGGRDG